MAWMTGRSTANTLPSPRRSAHESFLRRARLGAGGGVDEAGHGAVAGGSMRAALRRHRPRRRLLARAQPLSAVRPDDSQRRRGCPRAGRCPSTRITAFERWNGQGGPGNLNALACMQRAIDLTADHGIGCVALSNTNHWMRGGSYGWQAADAGVIGVCWTNTLPNMPPWGAVGAAHRQQPADRRDSPIHPRHVVLDMAMSQFSVGALASYRCAVGAPARARRLRRERTAHRRSGRARGIEAAVADRVLEGIRSVARARHGRGAAVRRTGHVSDLSRAGTRDQPVAGVHRDQAAVRFDRE